MTELNLNSLFKRKKKNFMMQEKRLGKGFAITLIPFSLIGHLKNCSF